MKFCQNCGSQLQEGAKFCTNCGTPIGQTENTNTSTNFNDASTKKQEYVGTIRKCPSCGAEVPAFAVTCPSCGHELNDTKISDSLKKFQEGLMKYEGRQGRDFVASFPIPNTREELGNFMIMIASILNTDLQNRADSQRISAFKSKFDEVKSKINLNLPENDPIKKETANWDKKINSKFESWESLNKKAVKKHNSLYRKYPQVFWRRTVIIAAVIIGFIIAISIDLYNRGPIWNLVDDIADDIKDKKEAAELYEQLQKVPATTKVFPKENVILPLELQPYFKVVSDCTFKIAEYAYSASVDVTLKCKKSIRADLDRKLEKKIAELGTRKTDYEISQSCYFYFLGNSYDYNSVAKAMLDAKPNEDLRIFIKREINYSKDEKYELKYGLEAASFIEEEFINLCDEKPKFYYRMTSKEKDEKGYSKYYYIEFDD